MERKVRCTIRKQKKKSYAMHMEGEECTYVLPKKSKKKLHDIRSYERNVRSYDRKLKSIKRKNQIIYKSPLNFLQTLLSCHVTPTNATKPSRGALIN